LRARAVGLSSRIADYRCVVIKRLSNPLYRFSFGKARRTGSSGRRLLTVKHNHIHNNRRECLIDTDTRLCGRPAVSSQVEEALLASAHVLIANWLGPILQIFTPKSGHCRAIVEVRFVPKADQVHRNKIASYSITSSAVASSLSGIWRPSAFAVLRLITNSNLVDWMTGRSAGLAPLRILPT
jgi:hypothetical protein